MAALIIGPGSTVHVGWYNIILFLIIWLAGQHAMDCNVPLCEFQPLEHSIYLAPFNILQNAFNLYMYMYNVHVFYSIFTDWDNDSTSFSDLQCWVLLNKND